MRRVPNSDHVEAFKRSLWSDAPIMDPLRAEFGDDAHVVLHYLATAAEATKREKRIWGRLAFALGVAVTLALGALVRVFA